MQSLSDDEITKFVERALHQQDRHPYSSIHLGLGETDLLELLHQRLSKRFIESQVNDIFQDLRQQLVARKVSLTTQELHTITRNCTKCQLSVTPELPKWNVTDPTVVVVIDSPSLPADAVATMIDGFKHAGLQSSELCLTYVNRCSVPRKYDESEVANCAPYLHAELQLLNPQLVVCLGLLPASILYGAPLKMKDLRGEVRWLGYWPILTTYSPMYVLKAAQGDRANILEQFQADLTQAKLFIAKNVKS